MDFLHVLKRHAKSGPVIEKEPYKRGEKMV